MGSKHGRALEEPRFASGESLSALEEEEIRLFLDPDTLTKVCF